DGEKEKKEKAGSGFWMTVLKVEIADIAFAIDSMLAAVALAITLPETGWGHIGGIDTGQFAIMFLGGLVGLIIIRFAATQFVKLLKSYPSLETAA
ncbi:TerC family protein, partial [Listeria monocytogenes]